jgi:hypothetical protein
MENVKKCLGVASGFGGAIFLEIWKMMSNVLQINVCCASAGQSKAFDPHHGWRFHRLIRGEVL